MFTNIWNCIILNRLFIHWNQICRNLCYKRFHLVLYIFEVYFCQFRIRKQKFLIFFDRVQTRPTQNRLHFLLCAHTASESVIFADFGFHFVSHQNYDFLVSAQFSQSAHCLHQSVLGDCGRKSQHSRNVGIHFHVCSSGSVLIENDECLIVGNARSSVDFVMSR